MVEDLAAAIHKAKRRLHPSRQRLTLPPATNEKRGVVLAPGSPLSDYSLVDGSIILVKDLGPQVGWTTVFVLEYAGPLFVYPLFYFLPQLFYSRSTQDEAVALRGPVWAQHKAPVQTLALWYYCFHYIKRILETLFVHRFSKGTMPLSNLFKNCSYYWGFSAYISYFINHPLYTPPAPMQSYVALGFAMLCQVSNLYCHLILANLRPAGSKQYRIPSGFLFEYVTCANYTTEIYGWVAFTVATQTLSAALFTVAGAAQMAQWALGKHKRLRKVGVC